MLSPEAFTFPREVQVTVRLPQDAYAQAERLIADGSPLLERAIVYSLIRYEAYTVLRDADDQMPARSARPSPIGTGEELTFSARLPGSFATLAERLQTDDPGVLDRATRACLDHQHLLNHLHPKEE